MEVDGAPDFLEGAGGAWSARSGTLRCGGGTGVLAEVVVVVVVDDVGVIGAPGGEGCDVEEAGRSVTISPSISRKP
jgi:hypothetical protein